MPGIKRRIVNEICHLPAGFDTSNIGNAEASFRCKGQLLDGFLKIDVLRYCGEPALKTFHKKATNQVSSSDNNMVCEEVEQWSYVTGPDKRSYTLEFERGRVVRIISGETSP